MSLKSIKTFVAGILIVFSLTFCIGLLVPTSTYAGTPAEGLQLGANSTKNADTKTGIKDIIKNIANTALFVLGAIAVLMLIYGGIRYTTSGGDEKNVTAAKNTIIYAVVGIVIAIMAYAIVNYVVTQLAPATTSTAQTQNLTPTDIEIALADDTVPQYASPEGVAVLTYEAVNNLTEFFAQEPAPQALLPSYGPSTDVEPIPEPTPSEVSDAQPLTSAERIATIDETDVTISELTAEADNLAAEGKSSDSAQKKRNANMIKVAKAEENRNDTAETGKNTGPRIKVYQDYTECPGAWCASFVSWVHHKATGNNNVRNCGVKQLMDSTPASRLKHYGQPKPGDILLWYGYVNNKISEANLRGHTGILIKILDNGKYKTIEGNSTNKDGSPSLVRYWTRPASYWRTAKSADNQRVNKGIHTGFITP